MAWALLGLYGLLALIALGNLLSMRRPTGSGDASLCVLIPARDEAENLARLVPQLVRQGVRVYVFDDESADATAEVAAREGAIVLRASEPLPSGWTGKNRACHELSKAVVEDSDAEWYLFLDADVRPGQEFIEAMRSLAAETGRRCGVITGFPQILPGKGVEPLFLGWVGWILLATNPFGPVSRTGLGHNRFTNGQVHMWRRDVYVRLWPNEAVKGQIMEDVMMGRLLARQGVRVEVANLSSSLSVRMYEDWRQTLDGMSKNSFEITGSIPGSVALAALLLLAAWGWVLLGSLWWLGLALLALGGLFATQLVRSGLWPVLLMPVVVSLGAFTVLRSTVWHRTGRVRWKGRVY